MMRDAWQRHTDSPTSSHRMARERILSIVGLAVVAAILAVAFRAYLQPDFVIDLGNLLWFCM
jgi:hypothetical protein